jgi:Tol biopolymer transport system component
MGLTLFFLLFFGYLLWYATAHFKNRFPGIAGLRIALISLIFAILSYFAWVGTHYVFDSLLLAFFAIVAGITSVVIAPFHLDEHKATWLRALFLAGSVVALLPVGIHTLSTENKMDLVDLGPAMQGITGSVETLTYSDDGRRMAFSQKNNAGWFLQVVCPESGQYPVFKIPAGESSFRPIFVEKGFSVVMDGVLNGVRNLWQVNSLDGTIWLLTKGGIEPFGDGRPWNEKTHQLLIVTKEKDKYYLKAYNLPKRKMETLLNSSGTFLTPSWTAAGDNISYVDGITHQPYIYNIEDKESALLTSNLETEDEAEPGKKPQRFEVTEVFSAPDDFRYLFVAQKDGVKSVWTVMPDGSKRYKLYETPEQKNLSPASLFHSLKGLFNRGKTQPLYVQADQFSWTPDAQQIIFQEKSRKLGFWGETYSIRILNANTGDVGNADSANLIASQISHNAPAISPDGVKIAFAAQQGLWVTVPPPSFIFPIYTSLWVAVLR